ADRAAFSHPSRAGRLRIAQRAARKAHRGTVEYDDPATAGSGPGNQSREGRDRRARTLEQPAKSRTTETPHRGPATDRHVSLLRSASLHPPGCTLGKGEREEEGGDVAGDGRPA